jgi:hypothetical protein
VNRGTEATLTRTIPRSLLSRLQRIRLSQYLNLYSASPSQSVMTMKEPSPCYDLGTPREAAYAYARSYWERSKNHHFSAWILA